MKTIVTLVMILIVLTSCSSNSPIVDYDEVNYSEIGEQEVLLSDFLNGSIHNYNFYDFYKAKWLMSGDEVKQQEDIEFQDQGGEYSRRKKHFIWSGRI